MPETLEPPVATDPTEPVTELQNFATDPQQSRNRLQPIRPPRIDKNIIETAKGLYLQGLTMPEIALQLKVQPATVRSWSFRQRWPSLAAKVNEVKQLTKDKRSVSVSVSVATPPQNAQSDRLRLVLARELEMQALALTSVAPKASDLPNTSKCQGRTAVLKTLADAASVIHDWDSQRTPGIIVIGDVERAIDASEDATPIDVVGSVEALPEATTGSVQPPTEQSAVDAQS